MLSFFVKSLYYTESGKVSFILQRMFLISAGNEHEYFLFFKIFLLRLMLQVDFKLMEVKL